MRRKVAAPRAAHPDQALARSVKSISDLHRHLPEGLISPAATPMKRRRPHWAPNEGLSRSLAIHDHQPPTSKKPKGGASKSSNDSSSKFASRHPQAPPTNRPSESEVITIEDDGDDSPRVRRVLEGKNARKRFMKGDIAISVAAKNSILSAVQDVDAYDGYKYINSEWTDATKTFVKEKWWCLVCKSPKSCSKAGKLSNLRTHRSLCPIPPGGIPPDEDIEEVTDDSGTAKRRFKLKGKSAISSASTTLAATSYHGPSLHGWLNGQQPMHVKLTRHLGLVNVVMNALPFQHLGSEPVHNMVKSIDAKATLALTSGATVPRDLAAFHRNLETDMKTRLRSIDTLFSVQHDAWTTKGFHYAFVAMLATYVDQDWEFIETLLSFDVLKEKHTGSTFSGHLARTPLGYDLGDKWAGSVTSDSAGTNHRMMDVLEYAPELDQLQPDGRGQLSIDRTSATQMKASVSALPRASMRQSYRWRADENKILCMNHHINLAVRAGFASLGIIIKSKMQRKVLDLQPVPAILVQDEEGRNVEIDFESWCPDEPPVRDAGAQPSKAATLGLPLQPGPEREGKGKGRAVDLYAEDEGGISQATSSSADDAAEEEELDSPVEEEDDTSEDDGVASDVEEEDYESSDEGDMGPEEDELLSDDGGGPEVDGPSKTRISKTKVNAVTKLEAFTTSIHRGPGRRDNFRARMAKEYHMRPKLAKAPFPPKPNATRWNSHFRMIKAALKIREAVDAHCRAHLGKKNEKIGAYLLTDAEWTMLENLMPVLKLAE
ncbi:hypothetical protein CF326_g7610, partial [Tilletia indica]